jgi:pimeloyl-ACP methyl ester carboxylesterase/DNA-binding CsgD family transcriptional regulator
MDHNVRYTKWGSVNIAYQVLGDGPVDLVLSPGWVTNLDLAWDVAPLARFLERLASDYRLILFDKRGTGLSDRLQADKLPTLQERMEDLVAVMDAAGSERAVLVGTLGGGAMSGLFAATYPERSAALILYGTFAKLERDTGLLARLAGNQEDALDRIEQEWGTEGVGLAFWAPSLVHDDEAKRAYLRLMRSSVSPAAARALMRLGYQINWELVVPNVKVPTLVLHRTGDLVVPIHQARKLADGIAGARFVELPGTDHLMWAGDQDSIINEVRRFLRDSGVDSPLGASSRATDTSPNDFGLSGRELEVLELIARGFTNKQIASSLHISAKTAGAHVSNILAKLSVERRAEAAAIAERLGLTGATLH